MSTDSHVTELYAVPLKEFVSTRNAVAARLRTQGKTDEAAEIARVQKPSAPLWVVNQLARQHPDLVRQLGEAVHDLKAAQLGNGSVAEAMKAQRAALSALTGKVSDLLGRAGLKASAAASGRIASTLIGAVADPGLRRDLLAGRLAAEHQPPGFDVFAGAAPSAATRKRATKTPAVASAMPARPAKAPEVASARPDAKALHQAVKPAETAARTARHRARDLEREATRLEREAAKGAEEVERLRRALEDAERQAAASRKAAANARHAADDARAEAERSEKALGEARAALD